MFDANMRHLPKNHRFFAKVYSAKESTKLYRLGLRSGMLVQCKMRDKSDNNPRCKLKISGKWHTMKYHDEFYDTWLVYEGNLDMTGFIDQESEEMARKLIVSDGIKNFKIGNEL